MNIFAFIAENMQSGLRIFFSLRSENKRQNANRLSHVAFQYDAIPVNFGQSKQKSV